jgi:hypothetical protein
MQRPNFEELQNVWLLTYSRASLLDARRFLNAMDAAKPGSVELRALIDAAVVAYARPFSKCQVTRERRLVPLKDVPPPPRLADFHQDALDLRNTMIGHKDATPSQRYTATPNVVLVQINSKHFALNTAMIGEMESPMKNALKDLCAYFVKHCDEKLSRWAKAHRSEVMKNPLGEYELVISEPPADWIIPFHPKRGTDFRA